MKRYLLIVFFITISYYSKAQSVGKCVVLLKDKANSPYSITNPSQFLSQAALQRRVKQGISIEASDLPVNPDYIQQIKNLGVQVRAKSKWLNAVIVVNADQSQLDAIKALPFVKSASIAGKMKGKSTDPEKLETPLLNKVGKNEKISNTFDYGSSFNQVNMLGGVCMHNQQFTGKNMTIAVLDAGFLHADTLAVFDSIWMNHQVLGTRDFDTGDTMVFEDHNHGTSVLSCIAGNIPGKLTGTAPHAKFWLLRTEVASSERIIEEYNWVAAAEFADSVGADIINSSLGYTNFDNPAESHVYADLNGKTAVASIGATMAARKGMLVCNSAGNDGANAWHYIGVPADADSILSVGAVNALGNHAGFSSYGPTADGRIKPTVCAQGQATVLADAFSNSIITSNGTSFSSPLMAGMAACLWQANPGKTNMQLIEAIKKSASLYYNPDNTLGYGIPNFCKADSILKGLISVKEYDRDNIIWLGPNPFNDEINFVFFPRESQELSYEIYDAIGRKILSDQVRVHPNAPSVVKINALQSLSKGVYLFVVSVNNSSISKKLIKE